MFGDMEMPHQADGYSIRDISGRTIQSDGTIVPFTGKPNDKLAAEDWRSRGMVEVFSMPDAEVGSIIQYRWSLRMTAALFHPRSVRFNKIFPW